MANWPALHLLLVGLGGFLGANARYLLSEFVVHRMGAGFPYHTLLVNLSGSFAIGLVVTLLAERLLAEPAVRLFVLIGFLGGYTTFSSYALEALALVEQGHWLRALAYGMASNGLGFGAVLAGAIVGRMLHQ